jgi:D-glycero-D-manno-heptose 1,7-bisphosphate phosphatase
MKNAVFFDRDGVLNKLIKRDGGYFSPRKLLQFKILPTVKEVLSYTKSKEYLNIVISNQPDVSRGCLTKYELGKMTKMLYDELPIDDVYYCMHDNDECNCRKPLPGLIFNAQNKWNIDLNKSIMVGDTWKDGGAAKNAKVDFVLLRTAYNQDYNCINKINNLKDITKYLN